MTGSGEGDGPSVEAAPGDARVRLTVRDGAREVVVALEPADALGLANDVLEATRASRRGDGGAARADGRLDGDQPAPGRPEGTDASGEFTRGGDASGNGDAGFDPRGAEFSVAGRTAGRDDGARDVWTTCHECGFSWSHSGGGRWTECPACGTSTRVGGP